VPKLLVTYGNSLNNDITLHFFRWIDHEVSIIDRDLLQKDPLEMNSSQTYWGFLDPLYLGNTLSTP